MALFGKTKIGGFMDEIRCDEQSYLVWKWKPKGSNLGETSRENAIRYGSSLNVKEGEVAIFVYKQNDEAFQDYIEGPYSGIIKTKNFPVLADLIGLAYEGGTPFQAEIYFINLANIIQVKFGVPYFDVFDPRFSDYCVPVATRGTITFRINDYYRFIELHRLREFNLEQFQLQIRDAVCRYVKDIIANAPATHNIPVIQIESKISQINDVIELDLTARLNQDFGVEVSGVDISAIEIDKSSLSYRELMAITKDVTSYTVKAETEAKIKDIHDKQRIDSTNYEELLKIQREEMQYAQHKQTETANFAAYQIEKQTEVGVAGANALGQMGNNGTGTVDLGNGGFNPASMMASMAVGGVVGQNIANAMGNIMSNNNSANGIPPIPIETYYVAVNNQPTGPFDKNTLSQMAISGTLTKESLVWKNGMNNWEKASNVKELTDLFVQIPPIPNI